MKTITYKELMRLGFAKTTARKIIQQVKNIAIKRFEVADKNSINTVKLSKSHSILICPLSSRQVKYGSLSTVVGDEKLTSREDLIGLLFFYVQSDEDTFLKVDEVSKTEAQPFDVFNQLVGSFQFCV